MHNYTNIESFEKELNRIGLQKILGGFNYQEEISINIDTNIKGIQKVEIRFQWNENKWNFDILNLYLNTILNPLVMIYSNIFTPVIRVNCIMSDFDNIHITDFYHNKDVMDYILKLEAISNNYFKEN